MKKRHIIITESEIFKIYCFVFFSPILVSATDLFLSNHVQHIFLWNYRSERLIRLQFFSHFQHHFWLPCFDLSSITFSIINTFIILGARKQFSLVYIFLWYNKWFWNSTLDATKRSNSILRGIYSSLLNTLYFNNSYFLFIIFFSKSYSHLKTLLTSSPTEVDDNYMQKKLVT